MRRDKTKTTAGFILVVIVAAEMFASTIITIGFIHEDVGVTRYNNYLSSNGKTEYYSSYHGSIQRIEGVVNQVLESDNTLYRMESTVYRRAGGNNAILYLLLAIFELSFIDLCLIQNELNQRATA